MDRDEVLVKIQELLDRNLLGANTKVQVTLYKIDYGDSGEDEIWEMQDTEDITELVIK